MRLYHLSSQDHIFLLILESVKLVHVLGLFRATKSFRII